MALKDSALDKWSYKTHTEIKHKLLIKYIGTWFTILGSQVFFPKLAYFDCFAGRGEYKKGEKGSPLLALDTIRHRYRTIKKLSKTRLICFFIEANKDNYKNLKATIEKYEIENKEELNQVKIQIVNGKFADVANKLLDSVDDKIIPSFFFIDPFGWNGIEFKTITRILSIKRCEVFINFMTEQVNRFFEDPKLKPSINSLFGDDAAVEKITNIIKEEKISRENALLKFYRYQLMKVAEVKYTFAFKMFEEKKSKCKYNLIHATNHIKGAEIMKGIMANEGTKDRYGYLGPADGQSALYDYSRIDLLKDFLLKKYSGKQIRFMAIVDENFNESPYVVKHYRQAFKELLAEKKVYIYPLGKLGGVNENAIIDFIA